MSVSDPLAAYLTRTRGAPVGVENLIHIPGGASRETYAFDAVEADGSRRGLILRRDPVGSLIDTDREVEFLAYRSFHGRVPVPEPVALEPEGAELERPFFIMQRVDGGLVASVVQADPYAPHAQALGEAFFSALGTIAATPLDGLPLTAALAAPSPETAWSVALDEWAGVIERDERHPQPIVHAAIRRLRANPPPPAQRISVVHGDYRSGNFLTGEDGRVLTILDWEMVHLGDPVEDLAWCFDPLWSHFDPERVAGTIPEAEAIAIWERESGLSVDPASLAWWKLFNAVKGQAIWTTSGKEFQASGGRDLVLGFSGVYTARRHDVIIADQLERLVEGGWT